MYMHMIVAPSTEAMVWFSMFMLLMAAVLARPWGLEVLHAYNS